jgi:hypothetical protein
LTNWVRVVQKKVKKTSGFDTFKTAICCNTLKVGLTFICSNHFPKLEVVTDTIERNILNLAARKEFIPLVYERKLFGQFKPLASFFKDSKTTIDSPEK